MANNTTGFTRNLVDAFGRVIPWGIMLIVIICVSSTLLYTITVKSTVAKLEDTMIKVRNATIGNEELLQKIRRNVREGIEYTADTAISKSQEALSPKTEFAQMLRRNLREAVDFVLIQITDEVMNATIDNEELLQKIRRNVREGIEYAADTAIIKSQEALSPKTEFAQALRRNAREAIEYTVIQIDDKLYAPYNKVLETE